MQENKYHLEYKCGQFSHREDYEYNEFTFPAVYEQESNRGDITVCEPKQKAMIQNNFRVRFLSIKEARFPTQFGNDSLAGN